MLVVYSGDKARVIQYAERFKKRILEVRGSRFNNERTKILFRNEKTIRFLV